MHTVARPCTGGDAGGHRVARVRVPYQRVPYQRVAYQRVAYRGVVSVGVDRVRVARVTPFRLQPCRVITVGGMVAGHHVHPEDPGDDCQNPCGQGSPEEERLGKTCIK
ncbi:hypothetical protein GCM10009712_40360 [Pseudarthrobacter sulfonivorans]